MAGNLNPNRNPNRNPTPNPTPNPNPNPYDLRGSQEWPKVAAWLDAMDHRPSVRAVASDDGTLVHSK